MSREQSGMFRGATLTCHSTISLVESLLHGWKFASLFNQVGQLHATPPSRCLSFKLFRRFYWRALVPIANLQTAQVLPNDCAGNCCYLDPLGGERFWAQGILSIGEGLSL